MNRQSLKEFLDRKVEEYNTPAFIADDPVSIPHRFTKKQDIEIAGLFAAIFSWGNRTTIIRKSSELLELMDNSPHQFIVNHNEQDLRRMETFCHRTFNATDLLYFIHFLQQHYRRSRSLEDAFTGDGKSDHKEGYEQNYPSKRSDNLPGLRLTAKKADQPLRSREVVTAPHRGSDRIENALNHFYQYFFSLDDYPPRTKKHIASPAKNSSCKRLNMYLRWMVRKDTKGVDFGIWEKLHPSELVCPLDLHVARVARRFLLIDRPNADWESALSLTAHLREFDPADPVKYDFALFALGVAERF